MSSQAPRIPEFLRAIRPYIPGKPIEEVEREKGVQAVKLASNENPLGPSPKAVAAAQAALSQSHRYPDGGAYYLRRRLAERLGVPEDWLLFGNGSTELIELAALAFLREGDEGLIASGSFPMYRLALQVRGARIREVALRDYRYDLPAMRAAAGASTQLIFLANPNNPTGTWFTADELSEFLRGLPPTTVVVLDEAYFEYVEEPNYSRSLDEVRAGRNLIVLRTFSKVYGLAGLRIGYAIAQPGLLEALVRVRCPFNTSNVAQAAALAALDDHEHVARSLETNRRGRQQLTQGLTRLGLRVVPSVANFLFVELGQPAEPVAAALLDRGVIVRPLGWMGFAEAIRISIGTPAENEALLHALAVVLEQSQRKERRATP